jgi:hypothetical protein
MRGSEVRHAFHFTQPEYALAIRDTNHHEATNFAKGRWGVFLTTRGPHTDSAPVLLDQLFSDNRRDCPKLWGAVVYRVAPDPTGVPVIPDPRYPNRGALIVPTSMRGLADVADHLVAFGVAVPSGKGTDWMWWEP